MPSTPTLATTVRPTRAAATPEASRVAQASPVRGCVCRLPRFASTSTRAYASPICRRALRAAGGRDLLSRVARSVAIHTRASREASRFTGSVKRRAGPDCRLSSSRLRPQPQERRPPSDALQAASAFSFQIASTAAARPMGRPRRDVFRVTSDSPERKPYRLRPPMSPRAPSPRFTNMAEAASAPLQSLHGPRHASVCSDW